MRAVIFHGSKDIIQVPMYGKGKPYNDYGTGFYCTKSEDLAKEWAVNENRSGYANQYEIDCDGLSILDLNAEHLTILHWLTILLENREFEMPSVLAADAKSYLLETFRTDYKDSDIIIGYRADDSYFSFAQDFLNGTISYRQLSNAMYLGKLGQQFVLKSKQAFERIHFIAAAAADYAEWYPKKKFRDRTARHEYFYNEQNRRRKGDLYITQILDEEVTANDTRLRQPLS